MKRIAAAMMVLAGLAFAAGPLSVANTNPGNSGTHMMPQDSLYYYNPADWAANGVGLTSGGIMHWASRFTIDAAHVGTLEEAGVGIFIGSYGPMPDQGSMNVYDGTATSPGSPWGAGYTFGPTSTDEWEVYDCSTEGLTTYDGQELWVWIQQNHNGGQFPAMCDNGPCTYNYGCWVSLDGVSWTNLADYGLDYNWFIYVLINTTDVNENAGVKDYELKLATIGCSQVDISYSLPVASDVSVKIYDMSGKLITTLSQGHLGAGSYSTMLSGLKPGSYIVNLVAGEKSISKNLIITE